MGKYKQPYIIFKIASSKYWYYQTYNADGIRLNRKSTGQTTKAKALAYLHELYANGTLAAQKEAAFNTIFKDYFIWDQCPWVKNTLARTASGKQGIKESTVRKYRNLLEVHIMPYFGKYKVAEITARQVDKWLLHFIAQGLSGKTGNNAKSVLKLLFEEAINAGLIKENPCERVKALIDRAERKILITYSEAIKLFRSENWQVSSAAPYRLLFITACCTGLRLGELQALRHCDISIEQETLSVNGTYDPKTGKRTLTKNGESRIVCCPASLLKAITAINDFDGQNYIFSFYGAKPYARTRPVWAMRAAAKLAAVGEMPPHHWRAFFNTLLVQNNINPIKIKAVMGHANADMTDRYTRFTLDQLSDVLKLQKNLLSDLF